MSGPQQQITIAPVAPLDAATEVDLLSATQSRDPANAKVLSRLIELLLELDRFDAVMALLGPNAKELSFVRCMALTKACFSIRAAAPVKAKLALQAAEVALAQSCGDEMRARAFCDRGKARLELDRSEEGAAMEQAASHLACPRAMSALRPRRSSGRNWCGLIRGSSACSSRMRSKARIPMGRGGKECVSPSISARLVRNGSATTAGTRRRSR